MADNNAQDTTEQQQKEDLGKYFKWWKFPHWNFFLWGFLTILFTLYLLLHGLNQDKWGGEIVQLDKDQIAHIATIYTKTSDSPGMKIDYAGQVRQYLLTEFERKLDSADLVSTIAYLRQCSNAEATSFLNHHPIRTKSYFWLSSSKVYYEILFWSLAGVLCSILFMLSIRHRQSVVYADTDGPNQDYCYEEVPYQIAKLFYAPLCTIVLIFGYDYVQGDNKPEIALGKGMLAFSFLSGFFSGRVMTFINRIKDAILPLSATDNSQGSNSGKKDGDGAGTAADAGNGSSTLQIALHVDDGIDPALLAQIKAQGLRNGSSVSLKPAAGDGAPIVAQPGGSDPVFSFVADKIPAGKYILSATWEGALNAQDNGDAGDGNDDPQDTANNQQPAQNTTDEGSADGDNNSADSSDDASHAVTLTAQQEVVIDGKGDAAAELTMQLATE